MKYNSHSFCGADLNIELCRQTTSTAQCALAMSVRTELCVARMVTSAVKNITFRASKPSMSRVIGLLALTAQGNVALSAASKSVTVRLVKTTLKCCVWQWQLNCIK